MRRFPGPRGLRLLVPAALCLGLPGCELDEVTLATPEDIPVAEVYIMVGDGQDQVTAFLHWTLGTRSAQEFRDAEVTLTREDGLVVSLSPKAMDECLRDGLEEEVDGFCLSTDFDPEGLFQPATAVELKVLLDEDQVLRGATVIPGSIEMVRPKDLARCALAPGRDLELTWTRSPGVWAYSAETEIENLKDALALEGVEVERDSVALLGLAISDSDTTIVFPKEFGVFERFNLEQEIALALQKGLPQGAVAEVVVGALDKNYVNWVRGGNFNPSGPVRVSSLRGPGIGVIGSVFRRTLRVVGGDPNFFPGSLVPSCLSEPDS